MILRYLQKLAVSHLNLSEFKLIIVLIIRFILTNVPISWFLIPFSKFGFLHLVKLPLEGQTVADLGIEPFKNLLVSIMTLDDVGVGIMSVGL